MPRPAKALFRALFRPGLFSKSQTALKVKPRGAGKIGLKGIGWASAVR